MSNYGIEIISPDSDGNGNSITSAVVFSDSIRTCNMQVYAEITVNRNGTYFIPCPDANDTSKILITFQSARGLVVHDSDKTATGFTVTNEYQLSSSVSGTVIALRVG
tara:strand:+ start:658 stop:978 length:321 start_codon:yes stop_codon:yes gene_type:complete